MKQYLVRFTTTSGDYDKEWCYANSEQEAADNIRDNYWNIASINMITEL